MTSYPDLLGGPPPTRLPTDPAAEALLAAGDAVAVVARHPTCSAGWAILAEAALAASTDDAQTVLAYAYARTGYHRGLDALRRNGWKGHGPVPWAHEGNQGVLRCIAALGRAARRIGELDEATRCADLLRDADPVALEVLGDPAA